MKFRIATSLLAFSLSACDKAERTDSIDILEDQAREEESLMESLTDEQKAYERDQIDEFTKTVRLYDGRFETGITKYEVQEFHSVLVARYGLVSASSSRSIRHLAKQIIDATEKLLEAYQARESGPTEEADQELLDFRLQNAVNEVGKLCDDYISYIRDYYQ